MKKKQDSFVANILRGITGRIKKMSFSGSSKTGLTWFKIKKLKHLPYNRPDVYPFLGSAIHFNNGQELLHSLVEIFEEDIYDIHFNTDHPLIIDCGANIGLSVIYLKHKSPGARIIAFEPDPTNFKLLQKNTSGFKFENVSLRNEAIWKENTVLQFVSDGTLGSKLTEQAKYGNMIEVKATRLRDLLDQKIDFLKLDIEGAEYEVLKDCADGLSNVNHLFIEFHGYFSRIHELTEIFQLAQSNGFSYYIKEATNVYPTPFNRGTGKKTYDLQLNIFCFRIKID